MYTYIHTHIHVYVHVHTGMEMPLQETKIDWFIHEFNDFGTTNVMTRYGDFYTDQDIPISNSRRNAGMYAWHVYVAIHVYLHICRYT